MKIITYKVPIILKRNKDNKEVILIVNDEEKEFLKEEIISESISNDITKIAKELSDSNGLAKIIAINTLLPNEEISESFIEIKVLS